MSSNEFLSSGERELFLAQFFNDGVKRKITVEKIPALSSTGKNVLKLRCIDAESKAETTLLDFNLLNAVSKAPFNIVPSETIIAVTPEKTGTREWKGQVYDVFDYKVEETGEKVEGVKTEDIDF